MATTAQARLDAERLFYGLMAAMMIAAMAIGFAPTFFLRGIVPSPAPLGTLTPLIVLHGLLFTLWLLLFGAQAALVAAGRRDLHRRLGAAGMVLAALLVPVMYGVMAGMVARGSQPPFVSALAWTAVPLLAIPCFAILVWLGWTHRRDAQAHKRLMLGAALLFLPPSIGRLPIVPPDYAGFIAFQLVAWLGYAPLILWDWKRLGRLHWATMLGAGLGFVADIVAAVVILLPGWAAVAARLPGM